mmetsp:Transcript_25049/g.82072  ORF Transcript_25049/g.82072 Transcript_25049/m.82072 type:complete len:346 (+) Transcript_25049:947-1984(+)
MQRCSSRLRVTRTHRATLSRNHPRWLPKACAGASDGDTSFVRRQILSAGAAAVVVGLVGTAHASETPPPRGAGTVEQLEVLAKRAYEARDLENADTFLSRIIALEPNEAVWRERRAQVRVDLKRFEAALVDFDDAQRRRPPEYRSLGLLANRGLANEGLARWQEAVDDYSESIRLAREIGAEQPYVYNSRGNSLASLGRYEEALSDYEAARAVFQRSHNLSGSIYAQSNKGLMLVQVGREEEGERELRSVMRRAPGSIDTRAALAAIAYARGDLIEAEELWNWACTAINSGQLRENGPVLDGCALYRDPDWLGRIRRWPPIMVSRLGAFLNLQGGAVQSAMGGAN